MIRHRIDPTRTRASRGASHEHEVDSQFTVGFVFDAYSDSAVHGAGAHGLRGEGKTRLRLFLMTLSRFSMS